MHSKSHPPLKKDDIEILQKGFSSSATLEDKLKMGPQGLHLLIDMESKKNTISLIEIKNPKNEDPTKDEFCIAVADLYKKAKESKEDIRRQFIVIQGYHYTTVDIVIKASGADLQCFVLDAANDPRRWNIIDNLLRSYNSIRRDDNLSQQPISIPILPKIYLAESSDAMPSIQNDEVSCSIFALDIALHLETLNTSYLKDLKIQKNEFSAEVSNVSWLDLSFEFIKHAQSFRFIEMYTHSKKDQEKLSQHLIHTTKMVDTAKGPKMRNISVEKRWLELSQKALSALEQISISPHSSTSIVERKLSEEREFPAPLFEEKDNSALVEEKVLFIPSAEVRDSLSLFSDQKDKSHEKENTAIVTAEELMDMDEDSPDLARLKMALREDIESYTEEIRKGYPNLLKELKIPDNPTNDLQLNLNLIQTLTIFLKPEKIEQDKELSLKRLKEANIDVINDALRSYKEQLNQFKNPPQIYR